jgi:ferredoxin
MIITQIKPREKILESLSDNKLIFIIGCGSCADQCKSGGERQVLEMKEWLEDKGKKVTGYVVPDETCHIPLVKRDLRKYIKEVEKCDAILVMACGAGTSGVREAISEKRVYPANDTISLGNTIRQGNFVGRCSLCGECILDGTGGYCPVTICPKSIVNGPCGGMDKGKCEVNQKEDCAWALIYNTLSLYKDTESMKKLKKAKDYSKSKKGAKIEVL